MNVEKVIFCQKNTSGDELSNHMYFLMDGMEKTMLEFTEEDFIKGFQTFTESLEQRNLYKIFNDKIAEIVKKFMDLLNLKEFKGPEKNELISSAII